MKISYDWIKQYVDVTSTPDELAEQLSSVGLVCEGIEPFATDRVIGLEITANRPDWLSYIGVAREIALITNSKLEIPAAYVEPGDFAINSQTSVHVQSSEHCLRYTARVIRGVKVGPSPSWLVKRIESIGLRPVNNIVDITNFVLFETGQPLHAFDMDKLEEKRIIVRDSRPGEKIKAINGKEYELEPKTLVIADAEKPVAIAGIMGGEETEVGTKTTNILLECALFEPINIRRTARRLDLMSDSSYRFERGLDNGNLDYASRRACKLINEIAGGEIVPGVIDTNPYIHKPSEVEIRLSEISRVIGAEVSRREIHRIFDGSGFTTTHENTVKISISVPSWRHDISREIDLIEEIARIYGYDRIPESTSAVVQIPETLPAEKLRRDIREIMAALGYFECNTAPFVGEEICNAFDYHTHGGKIKTLSLSNPIRQNESFMRTSVAASLLQVKKTNFDHGTPRVRLFEIGKVYTASPDGGSSEKEVLAILDDDGYFALKGSVDTLFGRLRRQNIETASFETLGIKPETTIVINNTAAKSALGFFGEITADTAKTFDLKSQPAIAELEIERILEMEQKMLLFEELPKYPAIERDLAFVVDEEKTWAEILETAKAIDSDLIEEIKMMDIYRGKQIPSGQKSIAFSFRMRSKKKTLTDEEANSVQEKIITAMKEKLGGELRK